MKLTINHKSGINIFFAVTLALTQTGCNNCQSPREKVSIIPRPANIKITDQVFTITPDTVIIATDDTQPIADYFVKFLTGATGFDLTISKCGLQSKKCNSIIFSTSCDKNKLGPEGYKLKVTNENVLINAASPAGAFYACQTMRQLLPVDIESKTIVKNVPWTIRGVQIEDKPRYQWRGMHLDVCRHFFPKQTVKKYIDLMALHKLNHFHWHLTEDQGWRIEIKKYPKLTEISAWRTEENGTRYGGFYTQDDIREVIEYARERFITVVPEIEMPGHSQAALAAYPELSCTGGPFEVANKWGVFKDVYCAGNDDTFEFLENVLAEVVELFPSEYIHIGGDECPKSRWSKCPKCQERIESEGLENEEELQSYFIKRISKFLGSKNKKLVGWDEILEGGLAEDAIVMSWRGTEGGITAAEQNHDVVMTPYPYTYFISRNNEYDPEKGHYYFKVLTLEKVYSYEPTPSELKGEQADHILGAQGCVWTEYVLDQQDLEYMAYPRTCALAEVVWSAKNLRDWQDFKGRWKSHSKRLDKLNVNYYRDPKIFDPKEECQP